MAVSLILILILGIICILIAAGLAVIAFLPGSHASADEEVIPDSEASSDTEE